MSIDILDINRKCPKNAKELSKEELLDKIIECAQILDDADVPTRGRFLGTEDGMITPDGRVIPWEDV